MSEERTEQEADPVGRIIDTIADTILDFRTPSRRRLTQDVFFARELASEIYDAITESEP